MDSDFEVPVRKLPERKGIVEVFRIFGVDCEGEGVAEIAASLQVLLGDDIGDAVGCVLDLRLESVRETIFSEYGMHLGVVLPGRSEHIDNVSERRRLASFPAVHKGGDLHSAHCPFRQGLERNEYVVGHRPGLHQHPGLAADHVEYAHERLAASLYYFYDFSFAALVSGFRPALCLRRVLHVLFLCDGASYDVPVQGAAGLCGLDKHIVVRFAFDDDEDKTVPCHLDFSGNFGQDSLFLLS